MINLNIKLFWIVTGILIIQYIKGKLFMKTYILGLLFLVMSAQVQAETHSYGCIDAKTGKDAGKISSGVPHENDNSGIIIYSYEKSSNEGWILKITEDGDLYNADDMVQQGREFKVGSLIYENFKLEVVIKDRKMICD